MISHSLKRSLQSTQLFNFSAKKAKMELTLRTPYKTYFEKFEGFSRIIAKTNEAALVVQNRSPAAMYVLPPGYNLLKEKPEGETHSGIEGHHWRPAASGGLADCACVISSKIEITVARLTL